MAFIDLALLVFVEEGRACPKDGLVVSVDFRGPMPVSHVNLVFSVFPFLYSVLLCFRRRTGRMWMKGGTEGREVKYGSRSTFDR